MPKIVYLFAILVLLTGCSEFARQQPSSITGIVKNKDNVPLSGVTVNCQEKFTVSGANGMFRIDDIDPGVFIVKALKDGYVQYSQSVKLESGDNLVDLELQYSYYNYSLSGTVSDQAGNPINDVYIYYVSSDSPSSTIWDKTDIRGSYKIPYVPRGDGIITFQHTDYVVATTNLYFYNSDKTYNIKLVAKTKGQGWTRAVETAAWTARDGHNSMVYDNKIWVLGGNDGSPKNDVWSSGDGSHWTKKVENAAWTARTGQSSIVFQNKLWLMGGNDGVLKNDVWYSSDEGMSWHMATANAEWSPRSGLATVVTDNKILVIGGNDGAYKNDVWSSLDGITWVKKVENAAWTGREGHKCVFFNNKIWLTGGNNSFGNAGDIWYTADGIEWKSVNAINSWAGRYLHTSLVYDSKLWVLGGTNGTKKNDVWYSEDGTTWTRSAGTAEWPARSGHTSVVFDSKLWVLGGSDGAGTRLNDIWNAK
ncbi:MAG: hypothetical protein DKM50_08185 [Candidatus Margulisiibacteriota bacterium]|nr:MAG: hypothetical protein A2X43_12580 [Candidatus Margulisbacteria bacterium GWD2_39_127]OGI01918.1 MAG: hypothetical protein A2X42_11825 [Candidatus Margulisbacteria bacterium GWF2_38_17]OGI11566.1 MAG: hypothetical protein A2X41_10050 [Candidatus Margulisbacteria bacterium GWE2_39_32]PZM79626.1 MAG: hypothetical protein DKM50_08185 [Candidatus Margulisiibacteriota bacterium]HAR62116.1 hypothetical protein [Candidatus Margulisiibacteriota bacterium]